MKKTLDTTYKLFPADYANAKAAELNADVDDDWKYTAVHCPKGTGLSFIEIHDEEGEFVSRF